MANDGRRSRSSRVSAIAAAHPSDAVGHFSRKLSLETDCWDVHQSFKEDTVDFVLLDVRSRAAYAKAHVPGATSLPHAEITSERMMTWRHDTLFVVYCAGPHCNGADRAALKLAELGRPVKIMIGGVTGWADEGFPFSSVDEIET
jgi:rhodanese-related sulfurtransferase